MTTEQQQVVKAHENDRPDYVSRCPFCGDETITCTLTAQDDTVLGVYEQCNCGWSGS